MFVRYFVLDLTFYQCSRDISLNITETTNLTSPSYPRTLTYRKGTLSCLWNIVLQTPSDFQIKFIKFKGSPLTRFDIFIDDIDVLEPVFRVFLVFFPSSISGRNVTNLRVVLHDSAKNMLLGTHEDLYHNTRTFEISIFITFSVFNVGTGKYNRNTGGTLF